MKFTSFSFAAYPVTDVARARAFYEGVLGLKAGSIWEGDGNSFIEYEIGPDTLAIGKGSPHFSPGKTGATVALEVVDFDASLAELKSKQVKFVMDAYESPVCNMALVEDPDGNQIMIHRRKAAQQ